MSFFRNKNGLLGTKTKHWSSCSPKMLSVCVEACGLGNGHSKGRAGLGGHTCVARQGCPFRSPGRQQSSQASHRGHWWWKWERYLGGGRRVLWESQSTRRHCRNTVGPSNSMPRGCFGATRETFGIGRGCLHSSAMRPPAALHSSWNHSSWKARMSLRPTRQALNSYDLPTCPSPLHGHPHFSSNK